MQYDGCGSGHTAHVLLDASLPEVAQGVQAVDGVVGAVLLGGEAGGIGSEETPVADSVTLVSAGVVALAWEELSVGLSEAEAPSLVAVDSKTVIGAA